MDPCLPQHDPSPGRRYRQLAAAMDTYRYDHVGPIALLAHLPSSDRFGANYLLKRALTAGRFALNIGAVRVAQALRPDRTLDDYRRYFPLIRRKPAVMPVYAEDEVFGWQRVAGPNPLDVARLTEAPPDFAVDDAVISAALGPGITLDAAIAGGRLFVTDYSALWPAASTLDDRAGERFLCAPKVLYALAGRALQPIAIQLRPTPGPDNPIFTPADGSDWTAAKLYAQCADTTSHEMTHHLAQTHLVLEPVAIAARRRLARQHPVGILLEHHLENLLAINDFGRQTLINPGGFLDQLMPGWLHETMGIVADGVARYTWGAQDFHADLDRRGLRDAPAELDVPYRDDGDLVWKAIHRYVEDYVGLYYLVPADVADDAELQRWVEEMQREGRARGLPTDLQTPEQLVALLTQILWMSGPKHAAVNYAQWDYIAYVPNMPFSLYGPAPHGKGTFQTDDDVLRVLPPRDETLKQILLMEALTGWQHTRLGHYRDGAFSDRRVAPLVARFQRDLADAERIIERRNRRRLVPYPYLLPSAIPNSTNT